MHVTDMNYLGLLHLLSEVIMPVLPLFRSFLSPSKQDEAQSENGCQSLQPPSMLWCGANPACRADKPLCTHRPLLHH